MDFRSSKINNNKYGQDSPYQPRPRACSISSVKGGMFSTFLRKNRPEQVARATINICEHYKGSHRTAGAIFSSRAAVPFPFVLLWLLLLSLSPTGLFGSSKVATAHDGRYRVSVVPEQDVVDGGGGGGHDGRDVARVRPDAKDRARRRRLETNWCSYTTDPGLMV
jgi:hypothetical protein